MNLHVRFLISVSSLILYALIFPAVYPYAGVTVAVLSAIPALSFGWLLGIRGSLIYGVLALPVNLLLFHIIGNPEGSGFLPNLVGTGTFVLASAGVGWVRDLNQQVKKQAEVLQAERQLLQMEIERRVQAEEQLSYEALHDPLTKIPNRRLFLNRLEHALEWSRRNKDDLCVVLYLDLNRFKLINDRLGHAAGDQLLIDVASRLKSSVRAVDTVARFGGDEFAILLEAVFPPLQENVNVIIKRIQDNLAVPYEVSGNSIVSQASIGVVMNLITYSGIDDILRDADIAMYQAKTSDGNCFTIFDVKMREQYENTRLKRD